MTDKFTMRILSRKGKSLRRASSTMSLHLHRPAHLLSGAIMPEFLLSLDTVPRRLSGAVSFGQSYPLAFPSMESRRSSVETPQSEEDLRSTKADASRSSLDGRVSKGLTLLIPGKIHCGKVISSYEAAERWSEGGGLLIFR